MKSYTILLLFIKLHSEMFPAEKSGLLTRWETFEGNVIGLSCLTKIS